MGRGSVGAVDQILRRYADILERNIYEPAIRDLENLKREPAVTASEKDQANSAIEGMRNRMRSIRQRVNKEPDRRT